MSWDQVTFDSQSFREYNNAEIKNAEPYDGKSAELNNPNKPSDFRTFWNMVNFSIPMMICVNDKSNALTENFRNRWDYMGPNISTRGLCETHNKINLNFAVMFHSMPHALLLLNSQFLWHKSIRIFINSITSATFETPRNYLF